MKALFIPIVLLASSCGQASREEATPTNEQPPIITAAQSVSLEFPLQFDPGDDPPGYIKVDSAESGRQNSERLISAAVLCSPGLAWIESTSHSMAVVMPSDENAVWNGVKGWRPSDEDVVDCVKQRARQSFFYRKLPTGIKTYNQN